MRTFLKELFCWKYVHIHKKSWKCLMRHKLETFLRKNFVQRLKGFFNKMWKKKYNFFWNVLCTHWNPCTQGTCFFYENCRFNRSVLNFTTFAKKIDTNLSILQKMILYPFQCTTVLKYLNHKCQKRSSKPFLISFSGSLICLLFAYL